jgi:RNA polymerase-binding transcription factor DksA
VAASLELGGFGRQVWNLPGSVGKFGTWRVRSASFKLAATGERLNGGNAKAALCGPCPFAINRRLDDTVRLGYRELLGTGSSSCERTGIIMMTKSELQAHRRQLLAMQDRLTGDIDHLSDEAFRKSGGDASGNLSHMPIHMADLGTDNFEQENTLNLLANEETMLAEITAALGRIDKGSYGQCEECQGDILKARLKELPYTRFCVECARKLDQRS